MTDSKPDSGQPDAARPGRRQRYRTGHAVYLVTVPAEFRPQRHWSWPDTFTDGELVRKNCPMREALGFCRTFNRRQVAALQAGQWNHRWAIVCRHLKYRHARLRRKGGAE